MILSPIAFHGRARQTNPKWKHLQGDFWAVRALLQSSDEKRHANVWTDHIPWKAYAYGTTQGSPIEQGSRDEQGYQQQQKYVRPSARPFARPFVRPSVVADCCYCCCCSQGDMRLFNQKQDTYKNTKERTSVCPTVRPHCPYDRPTGRPCNRRTF